MTYEFTNDWFGETAKQAWDVIIPAQRITNALEIGSYEGRSTTYLIDKVAPKNPLSITCVDTWGGGAEHIEAGVDMSAVRTRFVKNTEAARAKYPGQVSQTDKVMTSLDALSELIRDGKEGTFDLIYVDGSHNPKDVIVDAVLSFRLLKKGGLIIFDDYIWAPRNVEQTSIQETPHLAINVFVQMHWGAFRFIPSPIQQLMLVKS